MAKHAYPDHTGVGYPAACRKATSPLKGARMGADATLHALGHSKHPNIMEARKLVEEADERLKWAQQVLAS
jgi:hypothetical protein